MNIAVGILNRSEIAFCFNNKFVFEQEKREIEGKFSVKFSETGIIFNGKSYAKLNFKNINNSTFTLFDVKIGIGFHWQQNENQAFEGDLRIIAADNKLWAINDIDVEKYLYSVIASEMSAASYLELLKAQAVAARSWLFANIKQRQKSPERLASKASFAAHKSIKWYERDAHVLFDVCADDHCQRYQGVPAVQTPQIKQAIDRTAGEVLVCGGEVCDTRFSKCCGGVTERFSACWGDVDFLYLQSATDAANGNLQPLDLTKEENAEKWVLEKPNVFCNITDKNIINQVFKNYDQGTADFFRWQVKYSNSELSTIIKEKSGIDFGKIIDLVPLKRGNSGRIYELKIVGEKHTLTAGKELEIRKLLSKSHLYSSAFVVKKEGENFIFYGSGWGHGVGLCQTGAAAMAAEGVDYRQILMHYFKNSEVQTIKKQFA
jgi:SpoIID/LytB domain protein